MTPEETELVRFRVSRAHETLDEARLMVANGHLHASVNRIYYACFYAVSALLLTEGYSSLKHTGVRALFDLYWMKTSRLPNNLGDSYRLFFRMRHRGDYEDLTAFDIAEVRNWLADAERFVDVVTAKVREMVERQSAS